MSAAQIYFTPSESTYITPVKCPQCGGSARLMRRSPATTGDGKGEIRTFECNQCNQQTEMFIREDVPTKHSD